MVAASTAANVLMPPTLLMAEHRESPPSYPRAPLSLSTRKIAS